MGWRGLRSSPGYALWVLGSLAIGIAVAVAALALLNAAMFLPFAEVHAQDRLVRVAATRNCGQPDCWTRMSSLADYDAFREGLSGLQSLAAYKLGEIAVALPEARSMRAALTSANYFAVLGVRPAAGRVFDAADAETHAAVAVIAHSTWVRNLGAESSAIGRTIRVADRFVQIVGVAPPFFAGIDRVRPGSRDPDLWLPIWMADDVLPLTRAEQRQKERDLSFVGRLRDGVNAAHVQIAARIVAARLAAARDQAAPRSRADVRRVWRVNPETWQFGIIIVMPIPILVLAIACVNAANLMLARGSQRQRDIAIRLAIGAGRARIVRQLLVESVILACAAAAVAVPAAWWTLRLASSPLNIPIPIDPTVLLLASLTAVGTALTFGLVPALRVSAQRPSSTLGSAGARSDALPRQSRLRQALVVAQVALSLGLLATAWQLVSTVRLQAVSGGTPGDRLLIARFDLQPLALAPGEADAFYRDLIADASRLPGVEAAGAARHTSVWTFGQGSAPGSVVVWQPEDRGADGKTVIGGYAEGDLFEAVGLRLVAGRGFTESDRQTRPQVAVVNQTFADAMKEPAVGSILRIAPRNQDVSSSIPVRIVGVIEAALEPRLTPDGPPAAKVYLPSPIEPEPALALYVRTRGSAILLAQPVRDLVARRAPRVPVQEMGSLDEFNARSYETQMWLARAAGVLGVIGLVLATAGLYGVSSYVVALRTREIAIRMAIGARPQAILSMMLGQSMSLALVGSLVGGVGAIAVSRVIQSGYHGIESFDAVAFGGAAALFLAAMLVASAVPALRAARVDPIRSLKDA
jgi:putative ABC transport system permease protein